MVNGSIMRAIFPPSILIAVLLPGFVHAEFEFEEYKNRLPWIWETPARPSAPAVQDSA